MKGGIKMFGIEQKEAFRLLHNRQYVNVSQCDDSGVIRVLADARSGELFRICAKKVRRALAGRQRQILCVTGGAGKGNAFYVWAEELVAIDSHDGSYVILNQNIKVLGAVHGDLVSSN